MSEWNFDNYSDLFDDNSHIFCVASTGSGKTNFMERVACAKWQEGETKIIFFDRAAYEACQLGFPEMDSYLKYLIKEEYGLNTRRYPHEVYMPFAREKYMESKDKIMETKLPRHNKEFMEKQLKRKKAGLSYGWTNWKPYKIPFSKLTALDLMALMKKPTEQGELLLEFLYRSRRYSEISDLIDELVGLAGGQSSLVIKTKNQTSASPMDSKKADIGHKMTFGGVLRLLSNLEKSGFICNDQSKYTLDLDKIMRDSETITTFTFANVGDSFGMLAFSTIMRQILHQRINNKGEEYPQLVLNIPELKYFMPRSASDSPAGGASMASASVIKDGLSQGRIRGITYNSDSQTPQQVDSTGMMNFRWVIFGRNQKEAAQNIHENIVAVDPSVLKRIPGLEVGRFAVVRVGDKNYDYPVFSCPNLAYHRKERENVLQWVEEQPYVEMIEYKDEIEDSIDVSVSGSGLSEKFGAWTKKAAEQIVMRKEVNKLIADGMTERKVAETLGISRALVRAYLGKGKRAKPSEVNPAA